MLHIRNSLPDEIVVIISSSIRPNCCYDLMVIDLGRSNKFRSLIIFTNYVICMGLPQYWICKIDTVLLNVAIFRNFSQRRRCAEHSRTRYWFTFTNVSIQKELTLVALQRVQLNTAFFSLVSANLVGLYTCGRGQITGDGVLAAHHSEHKTVRTRPLSFEE